jgi:DNA sulfur modification protein DndB
MTENRRIELLGKLITEKQITSELKNRKKEYFYETVGFKEEEDRIKIKETYESNGWEHEKDFKRSVKMKMKKPHDVAFEDKVWTLLALMGYKFLNRDRNFDLPYDKNNDALTKQIDVFAKDDETILLIECKSAESNKRGDFKKELESYKGIISGIRKTIQRLFPNKKHKFKFILATNNLTISDGDKERLSNINGIHLNEDTIDYFFKLHSQLGNASKYQFLGNIFEGQEIPEMENKIPAVKGKMGGHIYYSFSTEPENLLKIGYVLHRNKANVNMMPTYQRLIKKSRLKSVGEFIENGGYFPNSIVISIDAKNCNFEPANTQVQNTISDVGILHLPKKYKSAYIIDGQHRLYGYSNSKYRSTNTIPVVAFVNLSREDQVQLFMQINENQKAVSKDLRNTLNADLLWTSDSYVEQIKALCARVSIFLGEDRNSPLFNKISIGVDKKDITMQAIENALKKSKFLGKVTKSKIEELGLFYNGNLDFTYERLTEFLSKGFDYLSSNIKEEWEKGSEGLILINRGIYAFILTLSDILHHLNKIESVDSYKTSINSIINETKHYVDPIITYLKEIDQEERGELRRAYGGPGENKYWRTFQKIIRDTHKDFEPEGLEEYLKTQDKKNNDRAFAIIREIETFFNNDFKVKLEEKYGKMWFKKGVPPQIGDEAVALATKKNREIENEEDEVEPWDCINIIAYRSIALKNWRDLFEKEYTKPGEEKISGGKDEKTKWMVKLEHLRNQNVHSYYVTEDELSFLEELYDWLIKKELRNKFQLLTDD